MAAEEARAPAAFLSYAHLDDEASGGQITRLRQHLALAVSVALGRKFEIFQDRDGIGWGQHWPGRLDEALGQALFLIPILTPAYFNSGPCRAELEKFLELERRAGRNDLILPIYLRTARVFDDPSDPIAAILRGRQYRDWRGFRHTPIDAPEVRQALDQLADEIEAAIRRPAQAAAAGGGPTSNAVSVVTQGRPEPSPVAHPPLDLEPIEEERRAKRTVALRAEPSLAARVVARLKAGAPVYVAGRVRDTVWLRIDDEGDLHGYVVEDAVEPLGATEAPPTTTTVRPAPEPGRVFRDVDAPWCPELVVIPTGRFRMGSPADEEGRSDAEGPQHEVTIAAPLALGRYPVTFEEYDAFCEATEREPPADQGWGRGRRPVINVSWEDAQRYVVWLRERTGQPYRLPSEAEWEYACRAGTTTPFWTGATIGTDQANYDGNYTYYGAGRKGQYRRRTTPVDTFPANPWGLHDMHGNVWEWVEDRWHDSYEGAPADGSAWVEGTQSARVVRGGSWYYAPTVLRSACRHRLEPGNRKYDLGFRVARALTA